MDFHLNLIFATFLLVINGSHAALPGEVYWKSKLPNTPLPKVLQQLFQLPENEGDKTNFPDVEAVPALATYGVGYWESLGSKKIANNPIYNQTSVYFIHKDLHPRKKMTLVFTKSTSGSMFLPRQVAESIPFSSNKSQEILNYFSINSTSNEAQIIKQTLQECEAPSIRGEEKYCATSFESLVDFVTEKYGSKVKALSNEVEEEENKKQEYIISGIRIIKENNQIVCHKQRYKYAVFYCHKIDATTVYLVTLAGDDGFIAKAVVVCHFDTSTWNPEHLAFQVLNVKPGGSPICHFVNNDAIVWVPL